MRAHDGEFGRKAALVLDQRSARGPQRAEQRGRASHRALKIHVHLPSRNIPSRCRWRRYAAALPTHEGPAERICARALSGTARCDFNARRTRDRHATAHARHSTCLAPTVPRCLDVPTLFARAARVNRPDSERVGSLDTAARPLRRPLVRSARDALMGETNTGLRALLTSPAIYEAVQRLMGAEQGRRAFVATYMAPKAGDRILDVGCGPAELAALSPGRHLCRVRSQPRLYRAREAALRRPRHVLRQALRAGGRGDIAGVRHRPPESRVAPSR